MAEMDYARIYRAFIADRRRVEPGLTGYVERHHILPRSLGGSDEAENLIRLTPEDHFFAHLLLAKIYGRGMWVAVRMMRYSRSGGSRPWVRGRYMYGAARRKAAEYLREINKGKRGLAGDQNGNHNPEVYEWQNVDTGEVVADTLHGMWVRVGGNRAGWTGCLAGDKQTFLGWTIKGRKVNRGMKGKAQRFINADGRTFHGTQKQFADKHGISYPSASRVCRHGDVTLCGWRLESTPERNPLYCKATGKPNRLGRKAA